MIEVAMRHNKPVRIGVNWGSLDQELLASLMDENAGRAQPWDAQQVMYQALISSALQSAQAARDLGMAAEQIILSCKVSGVQDLISVYRGLAARCDYPFASGFDRSRYGHQRHRGSGDGLVHLVARGYWRHHSCVAYASAGRGIVLRNGGGPGNFFRPWLALFVPSVTVCPGCGRTTSTVFQELAKAIDDFCVLKCLWRERYPWGKAKLAVMGASSTAQAKAKHADIGISLPGTGEAPAAPSSLMVKRPDLRGERIAEEFQQIVEDYIERRFG